MSMINKEVADFKVYAYHANDFKFISKEDIQAFSEMAVVEISAKNHDGMQELYDLLKDMFFDGNLSFNDEIYITNMRHKTALLHAKENLLQVLHSIENEMPEDGSIKLLSIGRFCNAKNFDNVSAICKLIRNRGLNVKWYLIGFGGDEALIRSKIDEAFISLWRIIRCGWNLWRI